jgi:hypothetical protein
MLKAKEARKDDFIEPSFAMERLSQMVAQSRLPKG